jgi:two-component system chemotaxis sensor kinase CheA
MSDSIDHLGGEMEELFFETASELLQTLNDLALQVERHPGDVETVHAIRRAVHTLKGDAAACGFRELSELAHVLEDALALDALDQSSLAEVAFTAADVFGSMLQAYRHKTAVPSGSVLQKLIQQLTTSDTAAKPRRKTTKSKAKAPAGPAWTEYEILAQERALEQGKNVYHVTATIDRLCAMPIAARQLLITALSSSGEILATRPDKNSVEATARMELLIASVRTGEQIATKAKIPTVISQVDISVQGAAASKKKCAPPRIVEVTPSSDEQESPAPTQAAQAETQAAPTIAETKTFEPAATAPTSSENTLRVDAERIDNLLNLVGELIIGKSMLQQALNQFARENPKDAMRGKFADAMAFQARVLNDLQRSVMKVRMVPVEQLFRRFPRMVRDVAKQCSKQVDLLMSGQDTDLDKSLLDTIAEPLTHMVRNSVSHGIESPEERAKLGKAPRGTIHLRSHHQGNQVVVEISDDGRGIDAQRLKTKALQQGILDADEAARMSDTEALELIFRPGFSTADEITEISGRGVGLDVVRSVMQRLKGSVEVASQPGQGTTFRLKLPLTLAIIKALLFRVEQRLYAIPLNAVAQIARARESELHRVDQYEVLQLRNQVLPLIRLGNRPDEAPGEKTATISQRIFILVIQSGERKLGLIVDALEGEEELVIKALDDKTVATDLVGGASILGDGRVVLIMNLAAIMERFSKSRLNRAEGPTGLLLTHSEQARMAAHAGGHA